MTQKALPTRGKIDKSDYIKFKNFCSLKDVKIVERETTEWENLFFSKLESRIHKGVQNNKKKWDKGNIYMTNKSVKWFLTSLVTGALQIKTAV